MDQLRVRLQGGHPANVGPVTLTPIISDICNKVDRLIGFYRETFVTVHAPILKETANKHLNCARNTVPLYVYAWDPSQTSLIYQLEMVAKEIIKYYIYT